MKNKIILIVSVLLFSLLVFSCKGKAKPAKEYMVTDDALIGILSDTYIAGGLMDVKEVRDMYRYRDSIINFMDIVKQHGYTTGQVDSTLKYYFFYKPKKLEKIYDAVTGRLLKMEAEVKNQTLETLPSGKSNLWNGQLSYSFPDEFITDSIAFNIPAQTLGLYTFKATYTIFKDDESRNPEVVIFFSNFRGKGEETVVHWDKCLLKKDGKAQTIELSKQLTTPGHNLLRGYLFYHSNTGIEWKKHARISNISVTVVPAAKPSGDEQE
jgi:hypothetical protein